MTPPGKVPSSAQALVQTAAPSGMERSFVSLHKSNDINELILWSLGNCRCRM